MAGKGQLRAVPAPEVPARSDPAANPAAIGRRAPIPAVRGTAMEPPEATPSQTLLPVKAFSSKCWLTLLGDSEGSGFRKFNDLGSNGFFTTLLASHGDPGRRNQRLALSPPLGNRILKPMRFEIRMIRDNDLQIGS